MLTARRRRLRGDDGTTLAELVVCMSLTTLVAAMALSFFVFTGHSTAATTASSFSLQTSRIALTTVTGALRLALPGTVTPNGVDKTTNLATSVTFSASDALLTGCPARPASVITIIVNGTNVRMDRTGPQNAAVAGNPCRYLANQFSSRVLVTGVRAGTGFTTYDDSSPAVIVWTAADVAAVAFSLAVTGRGAEPQTYRASAVISGDLS